MTKNIRVLWVFPKKGFTSPEGGCPRAESILEAFVAAVEMRGLGCAGSAHVRAGGKVSMRVEEAGPEDGRQLVRFLRAIGIWDVRWRSCR